MSDALASTYINRLGPMKIFIRNVPVNVMSNGSFISHLINALPGKTQKR